MPHLPAATDHHVTSQPLPVRHWHPGAVLVEGITNQPIPPNAHLLYRTLPTTCRPDAPYYYAVQPAAAAKTLITLCGRVPQSSEPTT